MATRISYGLLNLTHFAGHDAPRAVIPGEKRRVAIRLCDIGHRFLPSHRIRLSLSTAYWPTVWPSPTPVELTFSTGESRLRLPLLTDSSISQRPVVFGPGEGAAPEARTLLSGGEARRSLERDFLTGRETLTMIGDDGLQRIVAHGLEIGRRWEERYSILPDDPLSARIEARWTMRLSRADWQIRTETVASMTATATDFLVTAQLDAYEGEMCITSRRWDAVLPRDAV